MGKSISILRYDRPLPYREGYETQIRLRDSVERGEASDTLMLLEHSPTFTLGRNSNEEHLLRSRSDLAGLGIEVVDVDRGGDITYHGPGQLVAYPILDLNRWQLSIPWYLRTLEQTLVGLLAEYGLKGERLEGYTGVWVNGAKIAAIGVAIHRWVTFHGIALNVDPDMSHWSLIVPCGIPDKPVTSLIEQLGKAPTMNEVTVAYQRHFLTAFGADAGQISRG